MKTGEGKYFAGLSDEGPFYVGPCDTYDEALEEAKEEYADQIDSADAIVVGIGRDLFCSIDGDAVIDDIGNSLYDEIYEDALDGWCDGVSREAKDELGRELTEVFHKWLIKNGQPHFWSCISEVSKPKASP